MTETRATPLPPSASSHEASRSETSSSSSTNSSSKAGSEDEAKKPKRNASPGKSFLTGAISGVISGAALQPFDVVRTYLQAPDMPKQKGMVDVAREIVRKEGLTGLWRGTGPTCVRVGLGAGVYFASLDKVMGGFRMLDRAMERQRKKLTRGCGSGGGGEGGEGGREGGGERELPWGLVFCSGFVTRSLSAVAVCPVTVLKTRMEYSAASGEVYGGTLKGLYTIFRREGAGGLFNGLGPTIARDAPFSGLYLVLYSRFRRTLNDALAPLHAPSSVSPLLAGAVAGALATVITHPPDVVRTHMQLRMRLGATGRVGVWGTTRMIWKAQGLAGFMRGVLPRVLKRSFHQAVAWTLFEEVSRAVSGRTVWDKQK